MREAVIISAVRTAIGKFQGSLTPFSAVDLGARVVREAVRRAGIEPGRWMKSSWATWCRRGWARIPRGRRA